MINWRSTAVVSGATLLAGWFGWTSTPPTSTSPSAPAATQAAEQVPDIQQEAARLEFRLRPEGEYRAPIRNPFQFRATRPAGAAQPPSVAVSEGAAPAVPLPSEPVLRLTGIAEDRADGTTRRTAIVETASGVEFVGEGESLAGYTVSSIGDAAVELKDADGGSRRLVLP